MTATTGSPAAPSLDVPSDVDVEKAPATTTPANVEEEEYPTFRKLLVILAAIYLCIFIVALDRTIIGTAIPKITDEFHAITDVGWYGSAYLLTSCAFQLIYGRIYTFYSAKNVLLVAIGIFEIGSAVCGAAPTSKAFIIGRAVAGLGSAGIFSGCIIIMVLSVPLHKRPLYQGFFGAIFGLASVAGPLVGGAFTTNVTWRWCFYLNLPIGAIVVVVLVLTLHTPASKNTDTRKEQIKKLDPYGTVVFLPGIVCLLLALEWGGTTYAWSNARIIVLFILGAILSGIFIYIQFRAGEFATVPIRIITQRSVASGAFFSAMVPGSMLVLIYYLPIWFQAVKGVSAVRSGIDTLPLVLSLVVSSIIAGQITVRTGYYVPQLLVCTVIMSIGAGLLTTLKIDTTHQKWIGYQIIYGFGLGLGMQQANMAAQTVLAKKDVMVGIAIMFFWNGLGGAIFLSIAEVIFSNSLVKLLKGIPGISPDLIVHIGATDLRTLVSPEALPAVLLAYNKAISQTLYLGVGTAAITIISGLTMEWRNLNELKPKKAKKADANPVPAASDESSTSVKEPEPATVKSEL